MQQNLFTVTRLCLLSDPKFCLWVFIFLMLLSSFLQHHQALLHTSHSLSVVISTLSSRCSTSLLHACSDLLAIQGDSLTPLPVVHKVINSLFTLSDNPLRLLASPSGNMHDLLQVSLPSAPFETLSNPRSLWQWSWPAQHSSLSCSNLIAVTFAPSDPCFSGSSSSLGNKISSCRLGSHRSTINSDWVAGCLLVSLAADLQEVDSTSATKCDGPSLNTCTWHQNKINFPTNTIMWASETLVIKITDKIPNPNTY